MEPIFSGIHQIGIISANIRKTIEDFTKNYGIGPWNVWKFDSNMVEDMQVGGKRINYSVMVATCKSQNVDWEIIQPLDKKTIFYQFYKKYGEGLQHVNYIASDYNKAIEYLSKKGVKVIQYGNLVGKHIYIFFDTVDDAKHVMETSTNLPGFKRRPPPFYIP